jgi:hypothetical protein
MLFCNTVMSFNTHHMHIKPAVWLATQRPLVLLLVPVLLACCCRTYKACATSTNMGEYGRGYCASDCNHRHYADIVLYCL